MKLTGIAGGKDPGSQDSCRRDLQGWLTWQEQLHFTAIELGLDRCRKVAERMQLLPLPCFVVTIAGTNGKGSTAVMLENILRAAGYRTGLYTSPHLLRYNERIRVNGHQAGDAQLCDAFERIDRARGNISLTYFEFGTLAAMEIFRDSKVDIAVMEVGLGGRLDAVNMIDANISIISTIDIDHQQWLGNDRESIGREKAGVYRPQRPAICADPEPPRSVIETAALIGANLLRAGVDYTYGTVAEGWFWRSGLTRHDRLPLPGNQPYQVQNAAGVLMALQAMADLYPVPQQTLYKCLREFRMPGRFQQIDTQPHCILDVAHNRQSAAVLADNLAALPRTGKTHLILGMLKDKNHEDFIRALEPCVDHWYLCTLDKPRGTDSRELESILRNTAPQAGSTCFDSVAAAIGAARSAAKPGDRMVITGSFVTVGDAIDCLGMEIN